MNRYVLGVILAVAALLGFRALGTANEFFSGRAAVQEDASFDDGSLGTLPIDQAGRVVRRQGQDGTGMAPTSTDGSFYQNQTGMQGNSTIGSDGTVIPRTTGNPPFTNGVGNVSPATGDISPVDQNLVQPGDSGQAEDPNLDSIPALW